MYHRPVLRYCLRTTDCQRRRKQSEVIVDTTTVPEGNALVYFAAQRHGERLQATAGRVVCAALRSLPARPRLAPVPAFQAAFLRYPHY